MAKHLNVTAAAALAASCIALPAFAQPQAVTTLNVTPGAPTSIVVPYLGRSAAAVRQDIRLAAGTVCDNAVGNHEISFVDQGWCAGRAADKAYHQYNTLARTSTFAASGTLVLSAR
jgi:hypothetical protein